MKTTNHTHHTGTQTQQNKPFFNRNLESNASINEKANETPFFHPTTIQPKLEIGDPNDEYEREADVMADQVMRMETSGGAGEEEDIGAGQVMPKIQTKCAACELEEQQKESSIQRSSTKEEEHTNLQSKLIQREAIENGPVQPMVMRKTNGGGVASPSLVSKLNQTKGGGSPLPKETNQSMSQAFGTDFSQVRIHTNQDAVEMNQGIQAKAFTHGSDVYFNKGAYQPESSDGKRLLAHELTHVVQQGGIQRKSITEGKNEVNSFTKNQVSIQNGVSIQRDEGDMSPDQNQGLPQRRSDPARLASIQLANRGEDAVFVRIVRYLCQCIGRNVNESSLTPTAVPRPGITYRFCRGRTAIRVEGTVNPSSFTSGTATGILEHNLAPQGSRPGARTRLEVEGRNNGDEPQIGGRGSIRLVFPDRSVSEVGVEGEVFRGTRTGRFDSGAGAGFRIGEFNIGVSVTNPHDLDRIGVMGTFGVDLPGRDVRREYCRECRCPIVYRCYRDIPPRDYTDTVPYNRVENNLLRYYFRLNSVRDSRDLGLRQASQNMLTELENLLANGATISNIYGFASPEFMSLAGPAGEQANDDLSLRRAVRLRQILQSLFGDDVTLPEPEAGGELFGSTPSIEPNSRLADLIIDAGFSGPEELSVFLVGEQIANDQLADQFLELLEQVTGTNDRLSLFGISPNSPIAADLLGALEQFISNRGRGSRPWERVFEFLRFATVEVTQTHLESRQEERRTPGSVELMGDAFCNRYAQQAESNNLFGPAQEEPDRADCPVREPINEQSFREDCDYTS